MVNEVVAASIPIVAGAIGWVIRRQVTISETVIDHDKQLAVKDRGFEDLRELINTRFDDMDNRLERVERKVLNGGYTKL